MKKKFVSEDMKRAFSCKGFWVALIGLTIIFLHGIQANTNFEIEVSTYEIIANAMALSGFSPFAAIFPVLGYSVSFCEEYHSGYLRLITSRMGWKSYAVARLISIGLSGGMITGIPISIVCLVGYFRGVLEIPGFYLRTRMQFYIEHYGDWYILTGKCILGFLFGTLWALIGMAFSVWFCNRYVSLIAPFVLYEVLWMLLYEVRWLNPIYLIRGDSLNNYPLSGCMELVYIMITVFVIWLGLSRRCHYE